MNTAVVLPLVEPAGAGSVSTGAAGTGFAGTGLAGTSGLAGSGLAGSGLTGSGLAGDGVAGAGVVAGLAGAVVPNAQSPELTGGKGASLARLAAAGLPVPAGFVLTTEAYRRFVDENGLAGRIRAAVSPVMTGDLDACTAAAAQIAEFFTAATMPVALGEEIRRAYAGLPGAAGPAGSDNAADAGGWAVAVRSSATAEDLPQASFAGQQDSFLNIRGESAVLAAVQRCWASLWNARAIDYRARAGIGQDDVALAVVVQELVDADAAGVMFTANPMTGNRRQTVLNAAWGLGEAIVGGQVTPDTVVVGQDGMVVDRTISDKTTMTVRTKGGTARQAVPDDRRTAAVLSDADIATLVELGGRIEKLYGRPMDVEWARRDGRLAIVQARPITNLRDGEPEREEWNDSLLANYLWTSANLGEAIPSVMTPVTWSLVRIFMSEAMALSGIGPHRISGNIGGRFYLNLSVAFGVGSAFGMAKFIRKASVEAFGRLPDGLEVPALPMSRWAILRELVPTVTRFYRGVLAYQKKLPELLAAAPTRARELTAKIRSTTSAGELAWRWAAEVEPLLRENSRMLAAGARLDGAGLARIRPAVTKLVGEADANALLTGLSAGGDPLASLGPVVGLARVARGELDRPTYTEKWGHRCPDEFEISAPRPFEDPQWIDRQLAAAATAEADAQNLLERQEKARQEAWARFERRYPRRVARMRERIAGAGRAARGRESARSEVIRAFAVLRAYVLRAGELTGRGDDLFYLSIDEVVRVLRGDAEPLARVASRRATYDHYRALPVYPTLIRGAFVPETWAGDADRRTDLFDQDAAPRPVSDAITGFAGAAGVVEGTARVLTSVEEGEALRPGEILVTTVTNIGWTPLFPRAAAVVTDIGAPLSHAAIVARELGIPAVVGCGNAVTRLRTGDHIRVNGGTGTVTVLP